MKFSTDKYSGKDIFRNETLFSTANGNIGFRGDSEEKDGSYHKGTYINGFYAVEPIQYGENAYGYAKNHETILNLPDPKCIELSVNGYCFGTSKKNAKNGTVHSFLLELDLDTGVLSRNVEWSAADGNSIRLHTQRLVSFTHLDCAAIRYEITNTGTETIAITVSSSIDTTAHNVEAKEDPRVGAKFKLRPLNIRSRRADNSSHELSFTACTRLSGMLLAGCVRQVCELSDSTASEWHSTENPVPQHTVTAHLRSGERLVLTKYITYCHKKTDCPEAEQQFELCNLLEKAQTRCTSFADRGFQTACAEQKSYLSLFWNTARIKVDGDKETEEALQFNLFHLLQSAGKDGLTSIAAKGLTGEGYEGHFFWDSEVYVCPVFTYTFPQVAESLLAYRASILPKAKKRAEIMNLKGALYPWRTISGEETSAYYPAGTAQYHIDGDIIFALNKYLTARGLFRGVQNRAQNEQKFKLLPVRTIEEMAAETARMWISLGSYQERKNSRFCINEVTGPDEYTACVNNNTFTNLVARENLRISCRLAGNSATDSEKAEWKRAADNMYIPFDEKLGIYPQDDSFLDKAPWDFAHTPGKNYPLLLHYHPLVIYRHRVLKQPDLVLAQFLLSGYFNRAEKIRNFDFYEPYTTGDSSLSHCIQSIMACEAGNIPKALDYFGKTVRMDIDDINGNSKDGIHTACMAGSWMSVVYGFAGFRDFNGTWTFNPQLPEAWRRLSFSLCLEGHILDVTLTHDSAVYALRDTDDIAAGRPLTLVHRFTKFILNPAVNLHDTRIFSLKPELKAVLFDLDGVITDTARLHYQAWLHIAEENQLRFNPEINRKLLGISREDSLASILKANGVTWSEEKRRTVCNEKNEIYKRLLDNIGSADVLPGIRNLLENLASHGIKTAVASASKNAPKVISRLGLDNMFTAIADASTVQMSKPEPDIFLAAAEQTGTWYTDCIGIEDAEAGITAIRKAGMKAVGVCSASPLTNADARVQHTSEITYEFLKRVISGQL